MNDPTVAASLSDDALLGEIAGEFSQRLAQGEGPSIEEYAARFPHLADAIREIFPTLNLLRDSRIAGPAVGRQEPAGPPRMLGEFRILREIGRGGMGVVYEAEQQSLRRRVALKVLPFASMLKEEQLTRFKNEAYAAASLDHEHIVHAYAVGCEQGVHFFAMQYIEGHNLAEVIDQLRRLRRRGAASEFRLRASVAQPSDQHTRDSGAAAAPGPSADATQREEEARISTRPAALGSTAGEPIGRAYFHGIATLAAQAAEALDYAHQRGVVHRDIKPSNLLLDAQQRLYVTDFGLAFVEGGRNLTTSGDILGTLRYMSPEQALGDRRRTDHRTDIYSLGATLYELAALTPAFRGDDHLDLLRRIAEEPPPPVRRHNRRIPVDLETIVEKAMAKEPVDRYTTAAELAADLRRFAADEPVQAARPNFGRRASRWARRRAGALLVALTAAVLVLAALGVGTAVSIWYAIIADGALRASERASERSETLLYVANMKLASDALANDDAPRAVELLERHMPSAGETDRRGFEWYFFQKQGTLPPDISLDQGAWVGDVELAPDGKWLATTAASGVVRVYETATWEKRCSFPTNAKSVNGLAWSPDGRLLAAACADGSICIWNFLRRVRQISILAHDGEVNDVAFSPDGLHLYSCGDDNLAKKWDVETGDRRLVFDGHSREVEQIALSHDGGLLATASSDDSFAVWNAETAERLQHHELVEGRIVCVAFSPDSRFVVTGNINGHVHLADTETGKRERWFRQVDGVEALAFMSNGRWLATADRGGAVQLHSVPESFGRFVHADHVRPPRWVAHQGRALSLTATPDGQGLISGGRDGAVRVWPPDLEATRWQLYRALQHADIATDSSNRLYVAGRKIYVWDLAERRLLQAFADADPPWINVACSTNGKFLAAFRRGQLALFDLDLLQKVEEWTVDERLEPHRLAISPDGQRIALAEYSDREFISVYRRNGSQQPRQFPARQCECLAFSPDGRWLAAGHMDDARLFDLQSDTAPRQLKGHSSTLTDLAFSPDGKLLATVSDDRLLKLWRPDTAEEVFSIVAHRDSVFSIAFSPDGRTIATAGDDQVVNLWHTVTGQPLGSLPPERFKFRNVHFTADGLGLVGRMEFGSIVIYDATPRVLPSPEHGAAKHVAPDAKAAFWGLGDLPGGRYHSFAEGVSSNGQFVVGRGHRDEGHKLLLWTRGKDCSWEPASFGGGRASGVSDDGETLYGNKVQSRNGCASIWTARDDSTVIVPLPSHVQAMTSDGTVGVGRQWDEDHWRAFRWKSGRTEYLPLSPDHTHAEAFGVTPAGDVVLGVVYNTQNDSGRKRLIGSSRIVDARPVCWIGQRLELLPGFGDGANWWPLDISDDGSVVVGTRWSSPRQHDEQRTFGVLTAFRWDSGEATLLGSLVSDSHSMAHGVSGDGRIVVGRSRWPTTEEFVWNTNFAFHSHSSAEMAFIWEENHGIRELGEALAAAGAIPGGWWLSAATDISQDGTTIVGYGHNLDDRVEAWVAQLPRADGGTQLVKKTSPRPPAVQREIFP